MMIATLTGTVAEKIADVVVLDVRGVGYGVLVANEDFGHLVPDQPAKLYVYEHIREQAHDLYGFITLDTKSLFEQLLGVNGVGPKMALNVLSIGSSNDVRQAIATGDTKFIQGAQGVGKRVAERVVVELKDKVGLEGVELSATGLLQSDRTVIQDEAAAALIALGYSPQDAVTALAEVPADQPTEARIKQALKRA
jgi:Holliday junction DNA helicase RuvA